MTHTMLVLSFASLSLLAQSPPPHWSLHKDAELGFTMNPAGLRVSFSPNLRRVSRWRTPEEPWAYVQVGAVAACTPAYGQIGGYAEWQPHPVVTLRAQGDSLHYFGQLGGLLSFPSAASAFGGPQLSARDGSEERGGSQRLSARMTFQAQLGDWILRAPQTLMWTRFQGQGPFFYDLEYDTLLKDGDRLQDHQLQIGHALGRLILGPSIQYTRVREASHQRFRAGLFVYMESQRKFFLSKPSLSLQVGLNLKDPNRKGQVFTEMALGCSF